MAYDYDQHVVTCDHCKTPQPPNSEVLQQGGLIAMGWSCSGGKHTCPNCKEHHDDQN